MSKKVITKKRKALPCQITQLINAAKQEINEGANREKLLTQAHIKGIRKSLKCTNEQMEKFLTEDSVEAKFERAIEYEIKITTILSTIEFRL